MAKSSARGLDDAIRNLQQERQMHLDAIAEIDAVFARYGIKAKGARRRGRRKKKAKKVLRIGKRKVRRTKKARKKVAKRSTKQTRARRKFNVSGPQSILDLVKKAGKSGASGAEIVNQWKAQGRKGNAYMAIGQLVKSKKLKKKALKGQRGSRYSVG